MKQDVEYTAAIQSGASRLPTGVLMTKTTFSVCAALLLIASNRSVFSQDLKPALDKPIPRGARVFIAPVEGGFENYLAAAIQQKKVPVVVVTNRDKAQFEVSGVAESEKAGWAKMLFASSVASMEEAGIKIVDLKTDEVVFAYAVHKTNSVRGKQSAAEACAKHMKEKVEIR
jgi:N-dimethylarginine dimethylaminohydrolase